MSIDDKSDGYDLDVAGAENPIIEDTSDEAERPKLTGNAPPPPPPVRVAEVSIKEQLVAHCSRVFSDDPLEMSLADEERWFEVCDPPVNDDVFKRFIITRRSALFLGFLSLGLSALFHLVGLILNATHLTAGGIVGLTLFLVAMGGMAFMGFRAANDWALWRRERKALTWALLVFGCASLLACFLSVGSVGRVAYLVVLLPLLVVLGPAVTRTAIDVKLLFPRSGVGGWMLTVAVPLQSALTIASLMLFFMDGGGVLALLCMLALSAAPLHLLRIAGDLRKPTEPDETAELLDTPLLVLLAGYGVALLFTLVLLLSEGGRGVPTTLGILASVTGLYFMLRVSLLDFTVAILSEARAVEHSEALADAHSQAREAWEAFDREVTRDYERERAIFG